MVDQWSKRARRHLLGRNHVPFVVLLRWWDAWTGDGWSSDSLTKGPVFSGVAPLLPAQLQCQHPATGASHSPPCRTFNPLNTS